MTHWNRSLLIALLALMLAAMACNVPGIGTTPDPTPDPQTADADGSMPAADPTSTTATSDDNTNAADSFTPVPPGNNDGQNTDDIDPNCPFDASYVRDLTYPDGTQTAAGVDFDKGWQIINDGCADWPGGTELIFIRGDQMGDTTSITVPATEAGRTVDVYVGLTAPDNDGSYRGYWQLHTPSGGSFGPQIYVDIIVGEGGPSAVAPPEGQGAITGAVGYPSEFIPALYIYAENRSTGAWFRISHPMNTTSYRMDLPAGTYIIYAYGQDFDAVAGYTQATVCGLTVDCDDHTLVEVTVTAGEIVSGIDMTDFYFNPADGSVPLPPDQR